MSSIVLAAVFSCLLSPTISITVNSESVLRASLQLYMLSKKNDVRVEQHNSKGRSDLIVNFQKRRAVLELKFLSDGRNSESLLKEAAKLSKDMEYGAENPGDREHLKIACVFNGDPKVRKINSFQIV